MADFFTGKQPPGTAAKIGNYELPFSQNQLFSAGLGLLGSSTSKNPYSGLLTGFQAGGRQDAQRSRLLLLQEESDRRKQAAEAEKARLAQYSSMLVGLGGGMAPPSAADMARTPGINPDAQQPGQSPLAGLSSNPGALAALKMLGPDAGSKFLLDQMTKGQSERRIIDGRDGRKYYADTQEPVLPNVGMAPSTPQSAAAKLQADIDAGFVSPEVGAAQMRKLTQTDPVKRETAKGQDGRLRYLDTKELVFPSVSAADERDGKDVFDQEKDLRKEFATGSKTFIDVRDGFKRVQAAAKNPSAAGDLALVFNYMKVLDPGSTVREGEFATAAASGSFGERVKAAGAMIMSGERLSDAQRVDFEGRAQKLYEAQLGSYKEHEDTYRGLAERNGLNVDNVVRDYSVKGLKSDKTNIPPPPTFDFQPYNPAEGAPSEPLVIPQSAPQVAPPPRITPIGDQDEPVATIPAPAMLPEAERGALDEMLPPSDPDPYGISNLGLVYEGSPVTMEDIRQTAKETGMTEKEVIIEFTKRQTKARARENSIVP